MEKAGISSYRQPDRRRRSWHADKTTGPMPGGWEPEMAHHGADGA